MNKNLSEELKLMHLPIMVVESIRIIKKLGETLLEIPALILLSIAIFGYLNNRFLKLPLTVGLVIIALISGIIVVLLDSFFSAFGLTEYLSSWLKKIDFNRTLMNGMLSFLLFAGALHVDLDGLLKVKVHVSILATIGVVISTIINGTAFYYLLFLFDIKLQYIYCLIFGVVVSPTDPVAVLSLLKRLNVPKRLESIIGGESLFNDGVAVVVFSVLVTIAFGSATENAHGIDINAMSIMMLFLKEALGGAALGLLAGYITFLFLRSIDDYVIEVVATLALVTGAYSLALSLHISGPIAMVMAGVLIGNTGRQFAMSKKTRVHLTEFWHLIDEILNAALFVLIGFEVIILSADYAIIGISIIAVFIAVFARFSAVSLPFLVLNPFLRKERGEIVILTWAGLKGGISIALALSLPEMDMKPIIVAATYTVVIFSILIQGLSIKSLIKNFHGSK